MFCGQWGCHVVAAFVRRRRGGQKALLRSKGSDTAHLERLQRVTFHRSPVWAKRAPPLHRLLLTQTSSRWSVSAPRHCHSLQDEFVYILEGTPSLVTGDGEMPLRPGMCAGFKAGSDNAHQLRNGSDTVADYLEIGDRTAGDVVTYPDDDIKIDKMPDGRLQVARKDGSY